MCHSFFFFIPHLTGSLHSVKIMWPRGGDPGETSRSVYGFVCFHERSAAEDAVQHCRFHLCFGRQLRTGWCKPILMQQQQSQRPHPHPSTNKNNTSSAVSSWSIRRAWPAVRNFSVWMTFNPASAGSGFGLLTASRRANAGDIETAEPPTNVAAERSACRRGTVA